MAKENVDAYELGAMDDEEIAAFLVSPQDILDRMNEVKVEADRLNTIIQTDPKVRPEFKASWDSWYKDIWQKFYDSHTGFSGWFSRLTGTVMEEADKHYTRVKQWRDALEKEIGREVLGPKFKEDTGFPWKWVMYGTIAVAGIIGIGYAAKEVKGLVRG